MLVKDKIMKEILNLCEGAVYFTANEHKDIYEQPEEWLNKKQTFESPHKTYIISPLTDAIEKDILEEMIKRNNILKLQFSPATQYYKESRKGSFIKCTYPVGFYVVYHYDYDELIKEAKDILDNIVKRKLTNESCQLT